jgi:hypothetical protein
MAKIGLIAFAAAIALAGVSYAGEKITLVCSGQMSSGATPQEDGPESIAVDLDQGTLTWGSDTYPIASNEGNTIKFQSRPLPKPGGEVPPWTEGWLDRVTGQFYATYDWGSASKPATDHYSLTCKPAKPLF